MELSNVLIHFLTHISIAEINFPESGAQEQREIALSLGKRVMVRASQRFLLSSAFFVSLRSSAYRHHFKKLPRKASFYFSLFRFVKFSLK